MTTELHPSQDPALASLSSLGLRVARTTSTVVGRRSQIEAVERELAAARRGLACVALGGEPGIGKTRVLLAVEELARVQGFASVAVTADEEIRGPFLVARSLFAAPALLEAAERAGGGADAQVRRLLDALLDGADSALEHLSSDRRLLRIFDIAAVALRAVAAGQPLALLIDDLQWADEDSLRLLRYVVRPNIQSPILLVAAARREELAAVHAAVSLLADLERMGVLRRLDLKRFTQAESTELLQQLLGGPVQLTTAAVMHAQAEGVPFVLTEQVRAYRDAGLIQPIDGVWTLSRGAERLLPSAVRTLLQRREERLPDETKRLLAEAAVLGRNFSLRDLSDVRGRLGTDAREDHLASVLAPAEAAGILLRHPADAAADYGFPHEQVRQYAAERLTPPERRAIHAAVVELLTAGGSPSPGSLPLIARHAVAAGQTELGARATVEAARAALAAHAPEEALRLVDMAHPVASEPRTRADLLQLRDDALGMLRRPKQRLEALSELAALAEALGDGGLELDVMLRRAGALRTAREVDGAADLARRVRARAAASGDARVELAACLELGQDLLRADLGEAFSRPATEADLDGAEEAFLRAAELAAALDDPPALAAAYRELGIIVSSRVRLWYIAQADAGRRVELQRRVAAGESPEAVLDSLPVAPLSVQANDYLRRALEIYERLGDRPAATSTIIAMAVAAWAPHIHLSGSARRIEEIHRLMARRDSFTNESQRALAEAQMLYGSHVYARAKIFPDVALTKGREAHAAARAMGERGLEFAVAGSLALTHAELGEVVRADEWLGRAAEVAAEAPSPWRARQLELWRGLVCGANDDDEGLRRHLETAAALAADHGRSAHRCEILARLALESARSGARRGDDASLAAAERAAREVRTLLAVLPGHPPWGAQLEAAEAARTLARGDNTAAAAHARSALEWLRTAQTEDEHLDVVLTAAAVLLVHGDPEESAEIRDHLKLTLGLISQRIVEPHVRACWFRSPIGRELARLAGPMDEPFPDVRAAGLASFRMDEAEKRLLQLVAQGFANDEIAAATDLDEDEVEHQLAELFLKIGASSRAEATANAFMRRMV